MGEDRTIPGEFYSPYGLSIYSYGYVYVTDTYNHRIQMFNSNGDYIQEWSDSQDGRLMYVSGIGFNNDDYLHVLDSVNSPNRIYLYRFYRIPAKIEIIDSINDNKNGLTLHGTATDELTPITSVEYQVNSVKGECVKCTADVDTFIVHDGRFDRSVHIPEEIVERILHEVVIPVILENDAINKAKNILVQLN